MKKLMIVLCLSMPLIGCVPAALMVGATAGGSSVGVSRLAESGDDLVYILL